MPPSKVPVWCNSTDMTWVPIPAPLHKVVGKNCTKIMLVATSVGQRIVEISLMNGKKAEKIVLLVIITFLMPVNAVQRLLDWLDWLDCHPCQVFFHYLISHHFTEIHLLEGPDLGHSMIYFDGKLVKKR